MNSSYSEILIVGILGYCDERFTPLQRGFETTIGYFNAKEDHYIQEDPPMGICGNITLTDIWVNGSSTDEYKGTYNDLRFSQAAVSLIENHDQSSGPMFLYLALSNTHSPLQAPQEYLDLFSEYDFASQQTFYASKYTLYFK